MEQKEIFRARKLNTGEWIEGYNLEFMDSKEEGVAPQIWMKEYSSLLIFGEDNNTTFIEVSPYTLRKKSKSCDMLGRAIYEGDFVWFTTNEVYIACVDYRTSDWDVVFLRIDNNLEIHQFDASDTPEKCLIVGSRFGNTTPMPLHQNLAEAMRYADTKLLRDFYLRGIHNER